MAADPATKVHMYGKPVRPGRKIGHVTVTGDWGTGITPTRRNWRTGPAAPPATSAGAKRTGIDARWQPLW